MHIIRYHISVFQMWDSNKIEIKQNDFTKLIIERDTDYMHNFNNLKDINSSFDSNKVGICEGKRKKPTQFHSLDHPFTVHPSSLLVFLCSLTVCAKPCSLEPATQHCKIQWYGFQNSITYVLNKAYLLRIEGRMNHKVLPCVSASCHYS
jgi:hypothetical protein